MKNISQREKTLKYRVGRSRSGLGLFAALPIKKGEFITEYTGEKISNEEATRRTGKYIFDLNDCWSIDGRDRKNIGRYFNHSCRPNSEAVIEDEKHIMIYATRRISSGEELTINYGREYFDEFIKPFGCRCEHCQKKK